VEKNSIVFISEQRYKQKMEICSKPTFYDAVQLSIQLPQIRKDLSYQSIPFNKNATIPIHIFNSNIHIIYDQHTLQIYKENNDLTEKEVFEFLNHFAVKEDNRVSFLKVFPAAKFAVLK
jgi:hypothetical protein